MSPQLFDQFPPRVSRCHEVCGAGGVCFAAIVCGLADNPSFWISEAWQPERLNPAGLATFCDPRKLVFAECKDHLEVLDASEEALRSGAVSVVVSQLSKPLDFRQGRRLNLAAEAGKSTGVFLIPEGMGSNAAETRWQCAPIFDPLDSTLQRWELIKNKSGTLAAWTVRWDAEKRRVIVVSQAGK